MPAHPPHRPNTLSRWAQSGTTWLVLYVLAMTAVVLALFGFRHWALRTYDTPAAQVQWNTWRRDVARGQDQNSAPVRRRVPKSELPPALLLMRDHFVACLSISLLLSSALFLTFMVAIRGTLARGPTENRASAKGGGRLP